MRFTRPLVALTLAACLSAGAASAQDPPAAPAAKSLPGGTTVSSTKTVMENIAASRDLETFAAAVKAADLTAALSGPGPVTVFVPARGAFDRLEKGTLAGWMRPEGKHKLTAVTSFHIMDGALTGDALAGKIKAGKGEAALATMEGGYITFRGDGRALTLTDVNGTRARVIGEAAASNGVIFLIDNVLQP